jgi:hypothetical protein
MFIVDPFIAAHGVAAGECVGEGDGEGDGTMPPLVHAESPPLRRLASAKAGNGAGGCFMAQRGYYQAHRG